MAAHHLPGSASCLRGQPRFPAPACIRNPAEHFQQYAFFWTLLGLPCSCSCLQALSTVIFVFENIVPYCMTSGVDLQSFSTVNCRHDVPSLSCPARSASTSCPVSSLSGKDPPLDLGRCPPQQQPVALGALFPALLFSFLPLLLLPQMGWAGTISSPKTDQGQGACFPLACRIQAHPAPACWSFLFHSGYVDKFMK